jgi:microcystin degradation protein MlrC
MKIIIGGISQETCSFNVVKTTLQDFKTTYFKQGKQVMRVPPDDGVIGGFISVMKPKKHLFEGSIYAKSMSGGPLSSETFVTLKSMLLNGLKKAGKLDAVFLSLHGAMAAEDEPDTEGAILTETRELVGKDCFIGVALDHHANVTPKMVAAADVIVGYETQPHQLSASGAKTARVMLDIWKNKRNPRAALVKVPMLAPQDNFLTSGGPMKEWFDLAREIEQDPEVIVASPFPTQPWLDVPNNGWSCLVYADSAEKARHYAGKMARKAWDSRERFWRSERLSIPDTIAAANAEPKGLVVISDTGDAVFGGASGDNMAIIAEMLKADLRGPALVPVVDPAALVEALKAGVGREATLRIGGKMSAGFSPSLTITGVVKAMTEVGRVTFFGRAAMATGKTVLFERGNLRIVLLGQRDYAINHPALYEKLGLDVSKAHMVVLKTGSNFQHFDAYRSRLVRADSPGATQSDLTAFKWKNITHPMYPFDNIKDWRP